MNTIVSIIYSNHVGHSVKQLLLFRFLYDQVEAQWDSKSLEIKHKLRVDTGTHSFHLNAHKKCYMYVIIYYKLCNHHTLLINVRDLRGC